MSQPSGPLAGITVLDMTTVLFGPFGTQTLGDWGAEIIKVETLTGDTWRNSGQFRNRGMSGQFMAANRNKRSIALDLKHPDGKAVLRRLIPTADALVSNIRPAAWRGSASATRPARSSIRSSSMRPPPASARTARGLPGRRSTRSSRRRPVSPPPWAPMRSPPSSPA